MRGHVALRGAVRAAVAAGVDGCGLRGREQWHLQLMLKLCVVYLHLLADALLPHVFEVEEHVLAEVLSGRVRPRGRVLIIFHRRGGTYFELQVRVHAAEPRLELLVELPVLSFQLHRGQILLQRALLVVEREEEGLQVELREVFLA